MAPRRSLLMLQPAPPVRAAEGTSPVDGAVDRVDGRADRRVTRTSRRGGWGTGQRSSELALPDGEVSRLVLAHAADPAEPDHPLPPTPMRATRRLDLLLPLQSNAGDPFPPEDFEAFEDLLITLAGGFTRRGESTGVWRSPSGQIFHDRTRAYAVTVPADVADSVASSLSRFVTDRFRQEAAWIEQTPTFVAAV